VAVRATAGRSPAASSTLAVVFPVRSAVAIGLALVVVAAGCSGDDDASPESTAAATTSTVAPPREGDGQLKIGILLPTSDAVIGRPLIDATEQAISTINESGGVLGKQIMSVTEDEGSTTAIASESIQSLIGQNVDAIVGPSSSLTALATLGDIVSADVLACSPTASALALDNFPDHELFFRTIPSDSLQAVAIAAEVQQSGARTVAVVHVNDSYGRGLADAVTSSLEARRITVLDTLPFNGHDDDLVDDAEKVVSLGAQAAVVLADGQDGTSFLNALGQVDHSSLLRVVLNDAMRMPSSPQVIQALPPDFREKLRGVAPQAAPTADNPYEPSGFYAVNAFDCVNLIALAAMQAGSDAPADIAGQMASVSAGGAVCRTFAQCAGTFAESLDFDYNGPSGVTELIVRQGDPKRALLQTFGFDETGRDEVVSTQTVEQ
jgi:branched-chain amino acid transport system substrate-binding protein